jgi:hypothetical protein
MDLSPMARPETIQPSDTMVHVLTWPTTVLETGPVWATMKNCEMLIREANAPDWVGSVSKRVCLSWLLLDDDNNNVPA